ncbi:MAG: DUF4435 domain-containing protein [Magnetococcales bacterium]|nr:DUF4435 domain-containing protein [Magnetococcales bacterium]
MPSITASTRPSKRYPQRITVYLESQDDLEILRERWFPTWGEWIIFTTVDLPEGGGGGSAAVRHRVTKDRNNDIRAYGIVDRDVMVRRETFFEPDAAIFDNAVRQFLGNYIKVLKRYEIENYVLHPFAVHEYLTDHAPQKTPISVRILAKCMVDCSEEAILLTAANLVLLEHDHRNLGMHFGMHSDKEPRDCKELRNKILEHLQKKAVENPDAALTDKYNRMIAFLRTTTTDPEERWDRINRLIDPKMFLERLSEVFDQKVTINKFALARSIKSHAIIDPEIADFMDALKREAQTI